MEWIHVNIFVPNIYLFHSVNALRKCCIKFLFFFHNLLKWLIILRNENYFSRRVATPLRPTLTTPPANIEVGVGQVDAPPAISL